VIAIVLDVDVDLRGLGVFRPRPLRCGRLLRAVHTLHCKGVSRFRLCRRAKSRGPRRGLLAIICRELIVNVCCGDCGVSESHTQLM
jgi:hypothetical protein